MTTNIDSFMNTAPFEDEFGVTKDQYRSIETIVNQSIIIDAVKPYENDKGPGVYVLAKLEGAKGTELFYFATHAVGLVAVLTKPELMNALKDDSIVATIEKRKSKKSDRLVYAFKC